MVEIVPHERDKKAKQMYLFMRWFIRRHKKLIKDESENVIWLMMIYGENRLNTMWNSTAW